MGRGHPPFIRGSGISRSAHLRGIQLFQDGIPLSSVDGGGDFQEIDPTAFQYVEVFKGANGYQFGANALGGAINFVTPRAARRARSSPLRHRLLRLLSPSGEQRRCAGRLRWLRHRLVLTQEGFRDHSAGENTRGSANFGIQLNGTWRRASISMPPM